MKILSNPLKSLLSYTWKEETGRLGDCGRQHLPPRFAQVLRNLQGHPLFPLAVNWARKRSTAAVIFAILDYKPSNCHLSFK